jgi:hypothetical protein
VAGLTSDSEGWIILKAYLKGQTGFTFTVILMLRSVRPAGPLRVRP